MSSQYIKLCIAILKQTFGGVIQQIGECLLHTHSRTLKSIVKSTGLTPSEVRSGLSILIKFNLVKYCQSGTCETEVEYCIVRERIIFILKYPKCVYHIQSKYGDVAASIVEELIRLGVERATNLLSKCFINAETKDNLSDYKDMFITLVRERYIIRQPNSLELASETKIMPTLVLDPALLFQPPKIDLCALKEALATKQTKIGDDESFWTVNFQKFDLDFRDTLIVNAIEKKLGSKAAECFELILQVMHSYTVPNTREVSNPFTLIEVKQQLDKRKNSAELIKYFEYYFALISEDSIRIIRKTGDNGGGQYVVDFKKGFEDLAFVYVENVITEKFGSKAARIFRIIKEKHYVEQEDIQREAMFPAKEAKSITYKVYQDNFIHVKTIRKQGGGGGKPTKSFFLFYICLPTVINMLIDQNYKALYNMISKSANEKIENKRLIDKSQKLESIVETIKERGESEEYIAEILETLTPTEREVLEKVRNHIKIASVAELILDKSIFLLQLYQYHQTKPLNI